MNNQTNKKEKPVITIKPHTYQPSRKELREQVKINTTPENLAKSILRQVKVVKSQP